MWSDRSGWLQCAPLMLQTHYQQYTRSSFLPTFPASTGETSVDQISLQLATIRPWIRISRGKLYTVALWQSLGKLILSQFRGGEVANVVPSSIKGKV